MLTQWLAVAALLLLAPALAEAQQALCLRMGAMIQCDTTAPPSSSNGNLNLGDYADVISSFGDSYRRGQESAARTELLRQQTELLRLQNERLRQQQPPPPPRDDAGLREQHQKEEIESLLRARIR